MFEHRHQPLISRARFYRRLARHVAIATAIVFGSLAIGMEGYHLTEGLSWIDSFLNASMILTSMGPVSALKTDGGKLFASCYALFSGLVFVMVIGLLSAPIVHRFLHKFHMDGDSGK
jgi:hypothetical protein